MNYKILKQHRKICFILPVICKKIKWSQIWIWAKGNRNREKEDSLKCLEAKCKRFENQTLHKFNSANEKSRKALDTENQPNIIIITSDAFVVLAY